MMLTILNPLKFLRALGSARLLQCLDNETLLTGAINYCIHIYEGYPKKPHLRNTVLGTFTGYECHTQPCNDARRSGHRKLAGMVIVVVPRP